MTVVNGSTPPPVTPKATTPPTTAPVEPKAPDYAAEKAKLDAAQRAIELKERAHVQKVRKHSEEQKSWGEKLSKLNQYEKTHAQAKLNPAAFLKEIYGDNWHAIINETAVNGVPPANLIADEVARAEERMRGEFAKRDAEAKAAQDERMKAADQAARRRLHSDNLAFLKTSGKDYPVFAKLGDEGRVATLLAQKIEAEYKRTESRDEDGVLLQPGRILTTKEAADLLESEILALAEEAAAHEKYQPKLREKLQPPPPAPGGPPQQRRTLSNDLTGSTPPLSSPPASDAERRERALAARNAAANRAPK